MDLLAPTMQSLFAQLGEAHDEASITRFIEEHGRMCGNTRLHEAPFWTPSQARFLRDAFLQDANWASVVDALNARLHGAAMDTSTPH